uniref:Uncharacterized protein n=1 Tax=Panagrolaimus sp. JU765 TaxID=591449 RepID=A0AC34QSD1_9BILA
MKRPINLLALLIKGGAEIIQKCIHIANSNGFTKILPGHVLPFNPAGDNEPVYISIFYQERMVDGPAGPLVCICSAYPRYRDMNMIVGQNLQIHEVRSGDKWNPEVLDPCLGHVHHGDIFPNKNCRVCKN